MTSSRLDRLVTLLEKGSSQLIRNTAAQQLADIQKQHPDELFNLLGRVLPYLQLSSWDARTAAAKAVGGIVSHVDAFDPNSDEAEATGVKVGDNGFGDQLKTEAPAAEDSEALLQLETLDMNAILQHGKSLLGSAGKEYEYSLAGMDAAQRLAHQQKSLTSRLGLGGEYIEHDLINANDLASNARHKISPVESLPRVETKFPNCQAGLSSESPHPVMSPQEYTPQSATADESLSKRQLNQLKRKSKSMAKVGGSKMRVVDLSGRKQSGNGNEVAPANPHPMRIGSYKETVDPQQPDAFSIKRENEDDDSKIISDFKGEDVPEKPVIQTDAEDQGLEWPFERLCEFLTVDLFDPRWEVRHGAAMALREIIREHGAGAGRRFGRSRVENDVLNKRWLNDLACRLLCVLMLDRFGDYVSDTVVAPIRESVGQTIGALFARVDDDIALLAYGFLNRMVLQDQLQVKCPIWEVCHGGMIGLKYFVAVRRDLLLQGNELLDQVVEAVIRGLGHFDDDVRSVSAATLIPIVRELVHLRPASLCRLINVVWGCLSDLQDDLTASTGPVMDLLASLCTFPEALQVMRMNALQDPGCSFALLVPRLYAFFRHTITTVRSAVLRALLIFLDLVHANGDSWIDGRVARLIFQNFLVERDEDVLKLTSQVWVAILRQMNTAGFARYHGELEPHVDPIISLTMHPIGLARSPIPVDPSLIIYPSGSSISQSISSLPRKVSDNSSCSEINNKSERKQAPQSTAHNVDGHMLHGEVELVGADVLIRSRIYAAKALGLLVFYWGQSQLPQLWSAISSHLESPYATSQFAAAMVVEEYGYHAPSAATIAPSISAQLLTVLENEQPKWYRDLVSILQAGRGQCHALLDAFKTHMHVSSSRLPSIPPVCQGDPDAGPNAFSLAAADKLVSEDYSRLLQSLTPAQRISGAQSLADARENARSAIEEARKAKELRELRIRAAAASGLVALKVIPKKLSLVIRSIMESIKLEANLEIQQRSSAAVASLIDFHCASAKMGPVEKIIGNLVKFCCVDTSETPEFHPNAQLEQAVLSLRKEEDRQDHPDVAKFTREAKEASIMRRGSRRALENLTRMYGARIFDNLPRLRSLVETPIREDLVGELPSDILDKDNQIGQNIIDALSTLRTLAPSLHSDLHPWILDLMPIIAEALGSRLSVIRYSAAKCFATLCSVVTVQGMTMLVRDVLPGMSNALDVRRRQGVVECVYHLMHVMGDEILPYVIFLLVPILGRMSDSDDEVRLLATTCFASLVRLVPLEAGIPDPPGFSKELLEGRERERKFMAQMLDPKKIEAFEMPVTIKAELRSYQQDGVNWLAFLNRYHLHGVLCDDMGLGKTLQTLCIVASDHHMRAEEHSRSGSSETRALPSLIVCPPTLSGHWQQEIKQYAPFLMCVAYVGPPTERSRRRGELKGADIVITSYDICRNDNEVFTAINWNYCVLDEGHLIKNPKAKSTLAVKKLVSNHRLILSGTPIQNNVLELWSLFDFLMPGFLGSEKVFLDRFAKPIAASRHAKSSSKEQEAGALAIESLHKQVLPFLLRRLKEEVLHDLPPKILQNYYCDLSDLQKRLFDEFFRQERKVVEANMGSQDKEAKQHIFQALQYMRKLCNSPSLVIRESHKQYQAIQQRLASSKSSLRDIVHAPKLSALRDLLVDCGIGSNEDSTNPLSGMPDNFVSPHRALIFCQMKEMLDLVQSEVLGKLLPGVQYLRLDGSVEASRRQNIVNRFNTDPSYDCLLLTTSVGGLGLNLTGADTVIFVEHDWNPQKDIQAMDRAHRIGQKKVVNVYRLITRGTLEEKILNLQRFKIDVASTVVNQQNAGLGTMETDQILDLFNLGETAADGKGMATGAASESGHGEDLGVDLEGNIQEKGKKGWLDDLGELSDERQYQEEFNLDNFLLGLQRK